MSWQLYIAICVVFLSAAMLLQRVLLHAHKIDSAAFAIIFQFLVAAFLVPFVLVRGIDFDGFAALWLPITISALAFGIGSVLYSKSLQRVDASAFSVFFATHAAWVMLVGIVLLHEQLMAWHVVGVALIFISILVLVKNIRSLRPDGNVLLSLLTGLVYGVAIAAASYVAKYVDTWTWSLASFVLGACGSLLVSPLAVRKTSSVFARRTALLLFVCVGLYGLGNVAMMYAYKLGPFTLVAPLRQSGILLTTVLAFLFLRDERTDVVRKLIAAVICTLGVILLVR